MHAGKLVPRSTRPDFQAINLSYLAIPPRRMQMKVLSGTGSLVTPQIGDTTLSEPMVEAADGQSLSWHFPAADVVGGTWEFVLRWYWFPNLATALQNGVGPGFIFRVSGVEKARQIKVAYNPGMEWWAPFPVTYYLNDGMGPWVRTVPLAQFGECRIQYGSAGWAVQPEYKPYNTRP